MFDFLGLLENNAEFNNHWHNTLPFIVEPVKGESLYGYLLRLDIANRIPSGTVLRQIKKHSTGIASLNRPGLFLCSTIFDLNLLSELVNIPYDKILDLTLIKLLKDAFHIDSTYPELSGYSPIFKICPNCIDEHKLPLIHAFKNIDICIEHSLLLVTTCKCEHKITLFNNDTNYLECPFCKTPYKNLSVNHIDKTSHLYKKQLYLFNAYNSMLFEGTSLVRNKESISRGFEDRLHYVIFKNDFKHEWFKKAFGYEVSNLKNGHDISNLSLSKILDMLYELGYSPSAFKKIKPGKDVHRIKNTSPADNAEIGEHSCPNILCYRF